MKKAILVLSSVCLIISGCQESAAIKGKPIEVTIEGGGEFPEFLAGTWESSAEQGGWRIVFEPNGTIPSIVHTMGRTELKPGLKTEVPMKMNKKSIFKPGKWVVNYDPATSTLTVEIRLAHFYSEIGTGTVEGSQTDIFVGPVSKDELQWNANWTTFLKAVARTPENPKTILETDPAYGESQDIIFKKVKN